MVIPTAVAILAYHHPERRQECIGFMEDILTNFYDNRDKYKDIIDIELNESIVSDLIDLRSKDSYPLIEKLYLASMISDTICGDLEEIKAAFEDEKKRFFFHDTIPTIFEDYEEVAGWGKPMPEEKHAALLTELEQTKKQLAENKMKNDIHKNKITQLLGQPKLDLPKAGRNDLCPCGSEKKYKKCCGA